MSNLTKPCSASRHQTTARLVYRRLLCVLTPRESHMTHPGDSQDTQTGSMETNSSSCEFPWAKLSTCTTNTVKHAVAATHTLSLDPPVLNLSKAASVSCTSPLCKVSCTAVGNFEAIEMEKSAWNSFEKFRISQVLTEERKGISNKNPLLLNHRCHDID